MSRIIHLWSENTNTQKLYSNRANKTFDDDAGFDIFMPTSVVIKANTKSQLVSLGIKCHVENTINNSKWLSYILAARSSTGLKTPLRLSNCIGIIDAKYTGFISAIIDNISNEDYAIEQGQRLFQLINGDLAKFTHIIVYESLAEFENAVSKKNERNDAGFGSTGR